MATKVPSLNPANFKDEEFELWSIPAFDNGEPEHLSGAEIGSSKKIVQAGDVLLSRIVPHIRRAWVVTASGNGSRQIGSGEWIVFRSDRFDPNYLRHFLTSDPFHSQFMQTVAGVGGSLVRARPEGVKEIEIPLPKLEEQKRIADILDQADNLRRKRQHAIDRLNQLGQAIFYEMFASCPFEASLSDLCDNITDGTHYTPTYADEGVVFLSAKNVTKGFVDWENIKFIPHDLHLELQRRVSPKIGDVLLAKNGTTGVAAIVDRDIVFDIYVSLALLRAGKSIHPLYLLYAVNAPTTRRQFDGSLKGIGVSNLHLVDIRRAKIPFPSMEEQCKFVQRIEGLNKSSDLYSSAMIETKKLFASLQYRAFTGQL